MAASHLPRVETSGKTGEPLFGNYFVSTYPPFSSWTEEELPALRRFLETPLPDPARESFGLYVHLPFCVQRCQFCYYLSYDDKPGEMGRYLEALACELELYAQTPAFVGRKVSFVYFGGGTPSLLSVSQIRRLVERLQSTFPWSAVREVTFECAPKSATEDKLEALREAGVTRLSLGVQELDDVVLKKNGRVHLIRDVERAWEEIHRIGFEIVNIDLIAGLVGQTDDSFEKSLRRVIDWDPESVTIYQLEIPLNTPLYRMIEEGELSSEPASWDVKRLRLRRGFELLEDAGFLVRSAYTAVRDPVRHPFIYQDDQYRGVDLLGIGASSFSYLDGIAHQNLASLGEYLESLAANELPLWRAYVLTDEEQLIRELVLQLKLGEVDCRYFREKFGVDILQRFAEPLSTLVGNGSLSVSDDRVVLTRDGLLQADHLLSDFYLPEHQNVRYS